MTRTEVLNRLRKQKGSTSLRVFAARIGITHAHLYDVLCERREPRGKILEFLGVELGIEHNVTYRLQPQPRPARGEGKSA